MKYTAVIIEPRVHDALQFVLNNFFTNLDNDWNFIIFYGLTNKDYVFNIIKNNFMYMINRIKLINLGVNNLTIKNYNSILYNIKFYSFIETEMFLIFQTDSIIRKKYKYYINAFLMFDYVGAPWLNPEQIFNKNDCNIIGNGGLSLRKKSKMLEIIEKKYNSTTSNYNEDYFFTRKYSDILLNIPSIELGKHFSIETIFNFESFGVHKPWKHLSKEEYNLLINISPEVYELELLNNEYSFKNKKEANFEIFNPTFIEEKIN